MVDIIVALILFLGRHSLASRGYSETAIASLVLCFGVGYLISSLMMMRIVKPRLARFQMLLSLGGMVAVGVFLANTQQLLTMQVLYSLFPFLASLFFNAFQIYMLGVSNQDQRPLQTTIGHFTFAWSLGFALGPFVSSQLVARFNWSQVYYLAAFLAGLVALLLLVYRPEKKQEKVPAVSTQKKPDQAETMIGSGTQPDQAPTGFKGTNRNLLIPAWMGLLFGLSVWNVVLIYWPVQAVQWQVPLNLRSTTEFSTALAQGITALALTFVTGWVYKPAWLAGLGLIGVSGLVFFSQQASVDVFFIGAILYGVFLGSMYSFAAYHAMVEEEKAVKRVAINETIIGSGFLIAFPLSAFFHSPGESFQQAYLMLAGFLAIGLVSQIILMASLLKGRVHREADRIQV